MGKTTYPLILQSEDKYFLIDQMEKQLQNDEPVGFIAWKPYKISPMPFTKKNIGE